MFVKAWVGTILVTAAVIVVGCQATSSSTPGTSSSSSSSSGNGGHAGSVGNGGAAGMGGSGGIIETASSSSSSSSGVGGAGGAGGAKPFAACTDTTGTLKDCKNCCDCAADLSCADQKACRDTCNMLGAGHFMMNPNPMPVNAPSMLGPNGDYSTCTSVATEQECKSCCDCTTNYLCGDHQFCRNACTVSFGDAGAPPPDGGAGGGMP